jgi:hypothetical protein
MTTSSGLVCCLLRPALATKGATVRGDAVAEPVAMTPGAAAAAEGLA